MKAGKIAAWVAGAVILGLAAVWIGRTGGESVAKLDIARLELVWPSVMAFPDRDRAFLAGLSLTCDLHQRPMERNAVIACLQDAAQRPDATLPPAEDRAEATGRLNRLLSIAPGN